MSIIQAIILGIVQGLTEFLPISSSGHLALAEKLLNMQDGGLFLDSLLHLGTLIAVIVVFRTTVWSLIKAFFGMLGKIFKGKFKWRAATPQERMIVMLIVSCLPLIVAFLLSDTIEKMSEYLWAVGIALIINGFVMLISDRLPEGHKKSKKISFRDALIVGLAQMVAVTPGISRSGSTITAGVACGLDRSYAAKYSFILSIPTILGGAFVSFVKAFKGGEIVASVLPAYLCGAVAAMVVGFFAIKILQYLLKSKKFFIFGIYCFVVGAAALIANFVI